MAKIITVYINAPRREDREAGDLALLDMSYIRWHKISEALAALGHTVEMAVPDAMASWPRPAAGQAVAIPRIPLSQVAWRRYDAVKTLFHLGFETLEQYGGANHPLIIAKLGSVVAPQEAEGIYFYGEIQRRFFQVQKRIARAARYVTLLSASAEELWTQCFNRQANVLRVPGGVDRVIPAPAVDPFPADHTRRCIFCGHVYDRTSQPEANAAIIRKLNQLGALLGRHGVRLYLLGSGETAELDPAHVTLMGSVSYEKTWNYLHFADVGVVVAAGRFMHNNESSKIYHYLRAGLPVVSEAGFPNDYVVRDSRLGFVVENGALHEMARRVVEATRTDWNREAAVRYILEHHTWDARVKVYDHMLGGEASEPSATEN